MTKVITPFGTRPEIIRLSRVIDVLDQSCDHLLVHTGQNYDDRKVRSPTRRFDFVRLEMEAFGLLSDMALYKKGAAFSAFPL